MEVRSTRPPTCLLNVFTKWFLHCDVLPGMQIIAQFKFFCVVNTTHTHTNLAPGCLFQICRSVSMKSPVRCIYLWLIYSAGVSSCSCSGLLCWKLKFKRTNFITWKCFSKLEIPYCRYTTGWRYFPVEHRSRSPRMYHIIPQSCFFFKQLFNLCWVFLFCFCFL